MGKKNLKNNSKKNVKNSNKKKESGSDLAFVSFYKNNYKKLLIFPIFLFLFSFVMIFITIGEDGSPILRDVSLKGGLSAILEIDSSMGVQELSSSLKNSYPENSFSVSEMFDSGERVGYIVDTDLSEEKLLFELNLIFDKEIIQGENYNSNFISASLSAAFFKQAVYILIISFVLMSGVVFLYFRELLPSLAIVLSAIFDIVVTVGILNFLGIKVSVAGIGALLMIIGYSIDTDVLLTNRLVREEGKDYFSKLFFAFKTGTLMSFTTLVAGVAAIAISFSEVISEIATILVIGLIVDYVSTWIQNSAILLWWIEKKKI
jgi:preprotein translocase subunit SecF